MTAKQAALLVAGFAGCNWAKAPDRTCSCRPEERYPRPRIRVSHADSEIDPADMLALVRQFHDERYLTGHLKELVEDYCSPCEWIRDEMRLDDVYPLEQLDKAVGALCMSFVMQDGHREYGRAWRAECRP